MNYLILIAVMKAVTPVQENAILIKTVKLITVTKDSAKYNLIIDLYRAFPVLNPLNVLICFCFVLFVAIIRSFGHTHCSLNCSYSLEATASLVPVFSLLCASRVTFWCMQHDQAFVSGEQTCVGMYKRRMYSSRSLTRMCLSSSSSLTQAPAERTGPLKGSWDSSPASSRRVGCSAGTSTAST